MDDLRGKKVGVIFASPPQNILATREGVESVSFRSPEDAMSALAKGDIDVAYIWGASAGFLNRQRYRSVFTVRGTSGKELQWRVAAGVRKEDTALLSELNRALEAVAPRIGALMERYGVPTDATLKDDWAGAVGGGSAAPANRQSGARAQSVPTDMVNPVSGDPQAIAAGRNFLNQNCARCHGTDANSGAIAWDLRNLRHKYGSRMTEEFLTTVLNGRTDKGMPKWGGVLDPQVLWKIKVYLDTVQRDQPQ
jgi:mono/diheme cytochrome c family protein